MITDLHEKSINFNEIPGLLTIQKIKSTQSNCMHKATTRVTQDHGSMEGQDVLKLVESINNSKEKKTQEKEDREQKKSEETELFYRRKERCMLDNSICKAAKLKQSPMCRTVMKSLCGKSKCIVDGKRSIMVLPKSLLKKRTAAKNLFRKPNNKMDGTEDSESNRFHY